jgi:hypothetical protein
MARTTGAKRVGVYVGGWESMNTRAQYVATHTSRLTDTQTHRPISSHPRAMLVHIT